MARITFVPSLIADRYLPGALIGAGGMGRVYRGWDEVLQRPIALKLLSNASANAASRFRREAELSSRLGHENIVVTHDVIDLGEGSVAIVMELVDGPDLRQLLHEQGALSPGDALEIAKQLATGVAAVHSIGIVHGDLKPANIFVGEAPNGPAVRIGDFGIASLVGEARDEAPIMGTPEYMAPERFGGSAPSTAFDVYAIGAIVYEMLWGEPPVRGDSPQEVWTALQSSPPLQCPVPVGAEDDAVSKLAHFATLCLSFDPTERPTDGSAALDTLGRIDQTVTTPAESHESPIVVVGGAAHDALVTLAAPVADVGQMLGDDLVLRFHSAEFAFRWTRDLIAEEPKLRAACEVGPVVSVGSLFAGHAVGVAARLARISREGDVWLGPRARDAIGLGLRARVMAAGTLHLAGAQDMIVYRIRRSESAKTTRPTTVHIAGGLGTASCVCGATVRVAQKHLVTTARVACSNCGRVLSLAGGTEQTQPLAAAKPTTRDLVRFDMPEDEDDDILSELTTV